MGPLYLYSTLGRSICMGGWSLRPYVYCTDSNMLTGHDDLPSWETGTEYISTAFKTTSTVKKQLGLKVKLYYNAKSTAGYNMVKSLLSQGIEINGVGFQSRLTVGVPASTADQGPTSTGSRRSVLTLRSRSST